MLARTHLSSSECEGCSFALLCSLPQKSCTNPSRQIIYLHWASLAVKSQMYIKYLVTLSEVHSAILRIQVSKKVKIYVSVIHSEFSDYVNQDHIPFFGYPTTLYAILSYFHDN
jgi:hypothetical protein